MSGVTDNNKSGTINTSHVTLPIVKFVVCTRNNFDTNKKQQLDGYFENSTKSFVEENTKSQVDTKHVFMLEF